MSRKEKWPLHLMYLIDNPYHEYTLAHLLFPYPYGMEFGEERDALLEKARKRQRDYQKGYMEGSAHALEWAKKNLKLVERTETVRMEEE